MNFLTKKIIVILMRKAATLPFELFLTEMVMPIHRLKLHLPIIFNEFMEFRERLLIETGNEIKEGDNAWNKIYLAFKALSNRKMISA